MASPDQSEPTAPGEYPPTCEVRGWRVFTAGLNKDQVYSFADIDRIAANFPVVAEYRTPPVGLGHDKTQRLAQSIGAINKGVVTGCRSDGRGNLFLDLSNVPTWVGAKINAGLYPSGSIELKRDYRRNEDGRVIAPGHYLDGIALLGEEQPAVGGCDKPVAVFADGSLVPANYDPMLVPKDAVLSPPTPPEGVEMSLCFSDPPEPTPMNPQEFAAKFAAMPEGDDKKAFAAACMSACAKYADPPAAVPPPAPVPPVVPAPATAMSGSDELRGKNKYGPTGQMGAIGAKGEDPGFHSAAFAAFADDPATSPEMKKFATMFAAAMKPFGDKVEGIEKQFSAMSAKFADDQKKDEQVEMASFSDRVAERARRVARKIDPHTLEKVVKPHALDILTAKTFSSAADRAKAFSDYFDGLERLPDDPRLAGGVDDTPGRGSLADLTPAARRVIEGTRDVAPNVHKRLTAAQSAAAGLK